MTFMFMPVRMPSEDVVPMGDRDGRDIPSKVILFSIDFDMARRTDTDGEDLEERSFSLRYNRSASDTLEDSSEDGLEAYLAKVMKREEPASGWYKPHQENGTRTPLSICNQEDAVIIFVIGRKRNFWFATEDVPFRVLVDRQQYYVEAKRAILKVNRDPYTTRGQEYLDECRCAYFIAYSGLLANSHLDGKDKPTPFNIYLDLVVKLENNHDALLPIVIDPEVGWPGGNRPP